MLGVVAAAISEVVTGQTVWSQIAGKYVDGEIVERAHGTSTLYFFAIVVIFTMTSLAPKLMVEDDTKTLQPSDKEFCLLYTSPSPRDRQKSRMPSSA